MGYIFINEVGQWFYQLDHVTWSKTFLKIILICKFYLVLLPNLFHRYVDFIDGGKVSISGKMVHIWECF